MTDYTKSTNFASKDSLAAGNPLKIVKGTEIDTEFNNIATAVATKANSADVTTSLALKADLASPTFTGDPKAPTPTAGDNDTSIATTAFVSTAVATAVANVGYPAFKNRIINGGMVIDQRNAGASVTPTNTNYTLDRWQYSATQASKFTVQQGAGSLNVLSNTGLNNYMYNSVASTATLGAGDLFTQRQAIEGLNIYDLQWGTANAKTVTLSFWVYTSVTGTHSGSLSNGAGSRCYVFSFSVPSANTWTYVSVTVAGDTSGTWATDNTTGLYLRFNLGAGSTYLGAAGSWGSTLYVGATGSQQVVTVSGGTFHFTGVQLEKGSTATSFDYRSYGTELALCQRYYRQSSLDTYGEGTIYGYNNVSGSIGQAIAYPVAMRAAPTMSYAGTWVRTNCSGYLSAGTSGYFAYISITSLGAGNQYSNGTGYLTFNAEL